MKRLIVGLVTSAVLFGGASAALAAGQTGGSMSGHAARHASGGISSGGTMGGNGSGGMMGGYGSGGMMGGYGSGGMMGEYVGTPQGSTTTLAKAQQDMQQYLTGLGKPNLAIGEIMEFQNNFYAIVKDTATNHGAFEVLIDKANGVVFPEYGPNMMWNTEYSPMANWMGFQQPSGPMTVSGRTGPATGTTVAGQESVRLDRRESRSARPVPRLLHPAHPSEWQDRGDALRQRL